LSAQVIEFVQRVETSAEEDRVFKTESAEDSRYFASRVSFEVVYQVLFGPDPTPEDISREYFLLECD
jgi:hypothetical protein